jgi:hypothetical protein
MQLTHVCHRQSFPDYWTILSDDDKSKYDQLRKVLEVLTARTNRRQFPTKFQAIIHHIQQYSIHNDADDWKRCLICGFIWMNGVFAVSTRQLAMLLGKCKSFINIGFQSLGYSSIPISSLHASQLVSIFPFLTHTCNEVRQWTIRARVESTAPPSRSTRDDDLTAPLRDCLTRSDGLIAQTVRPENRNLVTIPLPICIRGNLTK